MAQLATTNICGDLTISGGLKAGENITFKGGNVAPLFFKNGYCGMGLPDGTDADWIRTSINGIIPWAAGGSGSIGTSSWPFSNIYSKALNVEGPINVTYPNSITVRHVDGANNQELFLNYANPSQPVYAQGYNRVWHQGNDGAGSGLDADLLDGRQSTNFASYYQLPNSINIADTNIKDAYITCVTGNASAPSTDWWHIINMPHSDGNGYGAQMAIAYHGGTATYIRTANGVTWSKWRQVGVSDDNNYLTCFSKVYNATWNDYAEWFEKKNLNEHFEPGDIVISKQDKYTKSYKKNDTRVVGVYSNTYGHILGGEELPNMDDNSKKFLPIGLSGRIEVKITGKIEEGDLIVTSDIPGVGIKMDNYIPGTVVGKALKDKTTNEIGKVKMLIMLS